MPQIHNDDARPTEQGEEASDDAANLLSEEADQPQNLADQPPAASGAPRTISSELDGEPDCSRKNAMRSSTILIHPLTTAAEIPGQDALDAYGDETAFRELSAEFFTTDTTRRLEDEGWTNPMSQFFLDEIEAATRCMTLNDFLARLQDNVEPGLAHLPVNHDRTDATSSATKRIKSTSS